jgi:hypothetical protein
MPLQPYTPVLDNPYPQSEWEELSEFRYESDLHLMRGIEAVKIADGRDAEYIVAEPYTISYKLDGAPRQVTVPKRYVD